MENGLIPPSLQSSATQHTAEPQLSLLGMVGLTGCCTSVTSQHHRRVLDCIVLAWEKVQNQNLKYSFYQVCITLSPSESGNTVKLSHYKSRAVCIVRPLKNSLEWQHNWSYNEAFCWVLGLVILKALSLGNHSLNHLPEVFDADCCVCTENDGSSVLRIGLTTRRQKPP